VIISRFIAEVLPGDFTLKSAGFLGGKHVLTTKDLSLLGEAGELLPNQPVTITEHQQMFFNIAIGNPQYVVTQPGGRMLEMVRGGADDIVHVITYDRTYR
jgi:hypothetical protein